MLEMSDARFAAGSPCAPATERSAALVFDTLFGFVSRFGERDRADAELVELGLALVREEAAIGRGELRRRAEECDVALDRGH
jgi:hypothetical protein